MYEELGQRKIRSVNRGSSGDQVEISLPKAALEKARVKVGDIVRVSVSRHGEIRLTPLRPDWPVVCGKDGCERKKGHAGECIAEEEVPY